MTKRPAVPAPKSGKTGRLRLPPGAGRAGEAAAEAHLRSLGWRVLVRNYRVREGELDIVALDGATYVFVEVKTRRLGPQAYGTPEESLTGAKKARLVAAAQSYLAENGLEDRDWRIDLVTVELSGTGGVMRVELFRNAVGE
jgi:putative endonuclease